MLTPFTDRARAVGAGSSRARIIAGVLCGLALFGVGGVIYAAAAALPLIDALAPAAIAGALLLAGTVILVWSLFPDDGWRIGPSTAAIASAAVALGLTALGFAIEAAAMAVSEALPLAGLAGVFLGLAALLWAGVFLFYWRGGRE